jgi:hypothetical protein
MLHNCKFFGFRWSSMWFWVHMLVKHWVPLITILKIFMELLLMMYHYHLIFWKDISLCSYFFFKQETVQNLFTSWYIINFKGTETPGDLNLSWHSFTSTGFHHSISERQKPLFIYDVQLKHVCAWHTFTFSHLMFDFSTVRPADTPPPPFGCCHHTHTIWKCNSAQIILSVFYTLEHRFLNLLKNTSLKMAIIGFWNMLEALLFIIQ